MTIPKAHRLLLEYQRREVPHLEGDYAHALASAHTIAALEAAGTLSRCRTLDDLLNGLVDAKVPAEMPPEITNRALEIIGLLAQRQVRRARKAARWN